MGSQAGSPSRDLQVADLSGRILGDTALYGLAKLVATLSAFGSVLILARALQPQLLGHFTLLVNVSPMLGLITSSWVGASAFRFFSIYEREGFASHMRASVVRSFCVGGLIAAALAFAIAPLLPHIEGIALVGWLFLVAGSGTAGSCTELLRADSRPGAYLLGTAALYLFPLLLILAWSILGVLSLAEVLFIQGGTAVAALGFFTFWWGRGPRLEASARRELWKRLARHGLPLSMAGGASLVLSIADRYLIGLFSNNHQVGIYTLAYQLASAPILLSFGIIASAMAPLAHQTFDRVGKEAGAKIIGELFAAVLVASGGILAVLSAVRVPLLREVGGESYVGGASVVPLVASGLMLLTLGMVLETLMSLNLQTARTLRCLLVGAVLNIMANTLLIPALGLTGAGVATLIGYSSYLAVLWLVDTSERGFKVPLRWIGEVALAGLTAFLAASFVADLPGLPGLVFASLIGSAAYLGTLFVISARSGIACALLRALKDMRSPAVELR